MIPDGYEHAPGFVCPECGEPKKGMARHWTHKRVGYKRDVPTGYGDFARLIECQNCFWKYWFHVDEDTFRQEKELEEYENDK